MKEKQINIIVSPPKIGTGKHKNEYPLVNNISVWYRYHKTRIMNNFKQSLKEWYIPENEESMYRQGIISFRIHRKDFKSIDGEALAIIGKWITDVFVDQGYISDDDKIETCYKVPVLSSKICSTSEMQVEIELKLYERITMTLEEVKEKAIELINELERLETKYTKAGSKRVRLILGELKNATPGIRKDLIEQDKSK